MTSYPIYSDTGVYSLGQIVSRDGVLWKSLIANNTFPAELNAYWALFG